MARQGAARPGAARREAARLTELVGHRRAPEAAEPAPPAAAPDPVHAASPGLLALLALDTPTATELAEYLTDAEERVRVAAIAVLTERTPDVYAPLLVGALDDAAAPAEAGARRHRCRRPRLRPAIPVGLRPVAPRRRSVQ